METDIVGVSAVVKKLQADAIRIARLNAPVLITGETGTGKDLFARFIHINSPRKSRPLRIVNCAAISADLFEAEFFGYGKGAFTGAMRAHKGHFQLADSGTLVLDEIAEIQPRFQAKLLRAIENNELFAIGAEQITRVDVRIIALTNRDLPAEINSGAFRNDLFYRLNTFHLHLPPLDERREDIPHIAAYLLRQKLVGEKNSVFWEKPEELCELCELSLPGNVRDLMTIVQRFILNLPERSIREQIEDLIGPVHNIENDRERGSESLQDFLRRMERQKILSTLKNRNDNITHTAQELGLSRQALQHRLRRIKHSE
ncbi:MAG: sigma 54-interacting transcriptional regulator [Calditrichia bacterium]